MLAFARPEIYIVAILPVVRPCSEPIRLAACRVETCRRLKGGAAVF